LEGLYKYYLEGGCGSELDLVIATMDVTWH